MGNETGLNLSYSESKIAYVANETVGVRETEADKDEAAKAEDDERKWKQKLSKMRVWKQRKVRMQ